MLEKGTILQTKGKKAKVLIHKSREKCGSCKACHTFGENKLVLDATNEMKANEGDIVNVYVGEFSTLHYLPLYILPILFMFLGYYTVPFILGLNQIGRETAGILGSFAFLIAYFVMLHFIMQEINKRSGKGIAKIVEIIDKSQKKNKENQSQSSSESPSSSS